MSGDRLERLGRFVLAVSIAWCALVGEAGYASDPFSDLGLGRAANRAGNSIDYAGQLAPMSGTDGPNTTPHVLENQLRGSLILHQDEQDFWSMNFKSAAFRTGDPVLIPTTGDWVPQNLWDLEVGAVYRHKLDQQKRETSISMSLGSASDSPFVIRDSIFKSTFTYRWPAGETNFWIFFVNETNSRPFLNFIPIPGIAWVVHSPATGVDAVLGLPFALVDYHPREKWNFRASVFVPAAYSIEAAYSPIRLFQIYTGLNWSQQIWLREDRASYADRLFYDRKQIGLGARLFALPVTADLFAGWEFNRRFFEGKNNFGQAIQTADLNPSWFIQLKLGLLTSPAIAGASARPRTASRTPGASISSL